MKINWRDCIRNRPKWKEFVEKAKTSLKLYCLKNNKLEGLPQKPAKMESVEKAKTSLKL